MQFPTIHMTIERMQYQIIQALYPYEQDLQEAIKQAVAQAVTSFSVQEQIEHIVHKTLHEQIQRKVLFAVQSALEKQREPALMQVIRDEVARQLEEGKR